jgi:hypothetical protein
MEKEMTLLPLNINTYALTPKEEAICARVGYERQLPMLGQPERNRNYSEGDIWEVWQHSVCAGAELAFARMIGLKDFEPHVNKFKSMEDVPGYEVRYSFGNYKLRLSDWDDKDAVYVLLVNGLRTRTRRSADNGWLGVPYKAVCWATGHEIVERGDRLGNSWTVHSSKANRIETLMGETY